MIKLMILWLIRRSWFGTGQHTKIINSNSDVNAKRYCPFWPDEWAGEYRPPWYRPFNILLHCWLNGDTGLQHDHPRWSITIVLRGQIKEVTPWGERVLKPGSVVIRSRKYIHKMVVDPEFKCKTWTVFIVGRRNHKQNYYKLTPYNQV